MPPTTTQPVLIPMRTLSSTPWRSPSSARLARGGLLQPQGREHGPAGVVLVGDGRAEQGHEAVAQELVDRPLVAVDLAQGQLEEPVQQEVHGLRSQPLRQGGRAHQVAEEHGDLLALALQGGPGLEACQVRRGVGLEDVRPDAAARRRSLGRRRAVREPPHSPQNRNPGGFSAPHWGHIAPSFDPHWPQNFMPGGLSNAPLGTSWTPSGYSTARLAQARESPAVRATPSGELVTL